MSGSDQIDKLRNHTKEIYNIMLLAQSSLKIVDYIYRTREDLEAEVINQNQFLKYTGVINWRLYVTELSKLFTSRESDWFNLNRFISKFKKGGEFERVTSINAETIKIWEDNLTNEKKNIDNLILQRDKLYSHTDKSRTHVKNELSILNATKLINIAKVIVLQIYVAVLDNPINLDPFNEPVEDLKKIIQLHVNEKKLNINFWITHCDEHGIDPRTMGLPSKPL